jgi:hypothetical protein
MAVRSKKTETVIHLGMTGRGPNKTAAKKDALNKIQDALTGDYAPSVMVYRSWVGLLYRNPLAGWCYHLVELESDGDHPLGHRQHSEYSGRLRFLGAVADGPPPRDQHTQPVR